MWQTKEFASNMAAPHSLTQQQEDCVSNSGAVGVQIQVSSKIEMTGRCLGCLSMTQEEVDGVSDRAGEGGSGATGGV